MLASLRTAMFMSAMMVASSTVCFAEDTTITIAEDSFAAIAYSPSTDAYAYSYGYRSRQAAETAALRTCAAEDARIAAWVHHGFCALALGDDVGAWGGGSVHGFGVVNLDAVDQAVAQCAKHSKGARMFLCLSSDGQHIYDVRKPVDAEPK